MDRSKFIGGSDAAGVLGLSRWDTPLSIWAEKTGQFIKPEVESEAAELGRELEDYVAKRFDRKTGKNITPSGGTIFHGKYPYLGANIDRLIKEESAGLECKTASAWKAKEWEGEEIPQEYIIQCYHYMMVTGFKKWYLAVLIGNQDFKIKELHWDDKIISDLEKREVAFWNDYIVPNIMPSLATKRDTDTLDSLFPQADEGKVITLDDQANILVENLISYKEDAKNLDGQIEATENQLKLLIGKAEMGLTDRYKIGWANSKWSGLDGKALEKEYPAIHALFYKSRPIRRFGYKPLGEKNVKP